MNPFTGGARQGATPLPETPYQRAGQAWDERIGSARVQARNWRLAALGLLALSAGLGGGLTYLAARGTVTPWVVEVDRLGEPRTIAPAVQGWKPTDGLVRWTLARFIEDVRALPADEVLVRQAWLRAYAFTDASGAQVLSEYARSVDPFAQIGKVQVSIEVTSVVRASPTSFRAAWIERRYAQGQLLGAERWTGIFTLTLRSPRTDAQMRVNPLGVFITAISWSREYGP